MNPFGGLRPICGEGYFLKSQGIDGHDVTLYTIYDNFTGITNEASNEEQTGGQFPVICFFRMSRVLPATPTYVRSGAKLRRGRLLLCPRP